MPDLLYKSDEKSYVLKPSTKKVFLTNFIKVIFVAALIIMIVFILKITVGLDTFLLPFEVYGIEINASKVFINFILSVLGIAVLLSLLNYLLLRNIKYVFYDNRLDIRGVSFFFILKMKEIPYENIIRISLEKGRLLSKIFNSGSIILDVTGMKEKEARLEFIDNPAQIANYIQKLVDRAKQIKQARFNEQNNINKIINKF